MKRERTEKNQIRYAGNTKTEDVSYPLRYVNPGDIVQASDHNDLVDAITSDVYGHDHNGLPQSAGGTGKKILHANLNGLSSDDHPQYLNSTRHSSTDHRGLILVQAGTDASKPAAGSTGRLYFATDTSILYYDNGSAWVEMGRAQNVISHSALLNLSSDDHPQYLNITRHDTTTRHTLGTVVPHDSHSNLSNLTSDDHPQYLRTDGTRALSGNFNANGYQFVNLAVENLTSDPTSLVKGRIWLRTDLALLSFSPDGTSISRVPIGTINVDSHSSRHLAGGADALPWGSGGGLDVDKLDSHHWSDLRFLYAGDETEKSVYGTTETEIKTLRIINAPGYGFNNIKNLYFVGEAYVTGGTGNLKVSIDGASSVSVWSISSTSYSLYTGSVSVNWSSSAVHTVSIRLVNSGSYYTYNRTIEIYVDVS
ncbi:MAG: hypothetical protein JTT12_05520 [Candidatus Brockarchaeota archaeon]|nr:hypothetical protein [Candidatus Brockarchaeota archaeon]